MTSTFIIVSILEVAAVALIITGFVFEKKLINFEEKFETALAKKIAHFLCTNKYTKTYFVKEKKTAQRRQDSVRARDRLSDSRQKGQQSCLIFFENRISLTALPFRQGGRFHFSGLMECQQPQPLLQPHPQSEALETPLLQPQPVSQSRRMMIRKMHQLFEQPIVLPPLQLLRKSAAVLTRAPLSSTYYEALLFAVTLFELKHNFLFSGVN